MESLLHRAGKPKKHNKLKKLLVPRSFSLTLIVWPLYPFGPIESDDRLKDKSSKLKAKNLSA